MPIYRLTSELLFPPPEDAEQGLLAVGGDLTVERLILAYSLGIFPWFNEEDPILWWSPDPRMVLFPSEFHRSSRLRRRLRRGEFRFTMDHSFKDVVDACRKAAPGRESTWIVPEMREAYIRLHKAGYAHSVEAWSEGELTGGLYGVSIGGAFFGESMFSRTTDASKAALSCLVNACMEWKFHFIDCQVPSDHLASLGARETPRPFFLERLRMALDEPTRRGSWHGMSTEPQQTQPSPEMGC
jgi:leucyl/phenylalanyl-tRNA--protein transferase